MVKVEPKFMKELHKIREDITREWKGKSPDEIVRLIREEVSKSKLNSRDPRLSN